MWELLVQGGVVMIPIVLGSVVALAIVMERLWTLRRARVLPPASVSALREAVAQGDLQQAAQHCHDNPSPVGRIVAAGLRASGQRRGVIKEAVEEAGRQEVVDLERYLDLLGTIVMLSPLLGLLGTVLGMIEVFDVVSRHGVGGDPGVLAGGISKALITTAAGLTVAIPALACHRYFESLVDRHVAELERFALTVAEQIQSGP
ncbi:MAG: MotA/TolQ/ExbB proton channel family protein [Magnetococcus sp. WYHC-3]